MPRSRLDLSRLGRPAAVGAAHLTVLGAAALLWLGLLGGAAAQAGAGPAQHRVDDAVVRKAVATPGTYSVAIVVGSRTRSTDQVSVEVGTLRHRAVQVSRGHVARLIVRVRVSGPHLTVSAVGRRAKPTLAVAIRRVVVHAQPQQKSPASTAASPVPPPPPAPPAPPAAVVPPAAPASPYRRLVWSDEFAGAAGSAPDPGRWRYDGNGTCGGNTPYTNTQSTANASIDGAGHLAITALKNGSSYTSAQLDTVGHFSFTYGTVEASMQLPAGAGLCSAFWMVGDGTPVATSPCWPRCGEIDVLESLGQLPTTGIFTLHGPTTDGSSNYQQFEVANFGLPDLTAGFHTYGLTWTPDSLTWTVDGVAYASETKAQLIATNGPSAWVYDAPFHIIFDLAVGNWQQAPNASTPFPARLLVDWVRVYGS